MILVKGGGPLMAVETYRSLDTDGSDSLDVSEFRSLLKQIDIAKDLPGGELSYFRYCL